MTCQALVSVRRFSSKLIFTVLALVLAPFALALNGIVSLCDFLSKQKCIAKVGLFLAGVLSFNTVTVLADGGDLTEVFSTKAFQGSWEVINKFNWLGWLMNFIISSFCILGLFLVMYSRMISLLYLSSRNLWDNVADVKGNCQGEFFGLKAMLDRTWKGTDGSGADAFITFFYGLLPNVKKYSDYNDEKSYGNFSEDDNALNYILKTAPSTILLIVFLSLGFSGTLGRLYGTCVDGIVAIADNMVNINLERYVDQIFAQGNHYKFVIDAEGTNKSRLEQYVAQRAYQEIVGKANILDGDMRRQVGTKIEGEVRSQFQNKEGDLGKMMGLENGITNDSQWKGVDARVVLSPDGTDPDGGFSIDATEWFGAPTKVKVYLTAKRVHGDYFNRSNVSDTSANQKGKK